jgi:hypothetical protein
MEISSRVLGQEHLSTLNSIDNLAYTLCSQGRLNEAEVLEVHIMETAKRVLGQEHHYTLIIMGNLAATYLKQGRLK